MNWDIQKSIKDELSARREQAQRKAAQQQTAAWAANPELKQVEAIMNAIHIRKSYLRLRMALPKAIETKMATLAPELCDADPAVLDRALEKLALRRKTLLQTLGVGEVGFAPVYTCSICGDTGRLPADQGGGVCHCYRILLAEKLREKANLPAGKVTFDQFNPAFYPDTPDQQQYGIALSPRAHMINVKARCEQFVANFHCPEAPNLLFIGGSGVGKTFLSNCIASSLLDQGVPALYMPVSMLFKPFSAAAFASEEEKEMLWHLKNMILNVELLIIDDLGTEKQTATRYEEILEILNTREINGRHKSCKTIITTNMTPRNLFDTYGERVASRILGAFDLLRFCGEDIRLQQRSSKTVG